MREIGPELALKTSVPLGTVLDGKVTVVDLKLHKTVMQASMKADHLAKAERLVLLKDRRDFFIGCINPIDPQLQPFGGIMSNLYPNTGLRSVPVNGMLYAFDRATGKSPWHVDAGNQQVLLAKQGAREHLSTPQHRAHKPKRIGPGERFVLE